VTIPLYRNRGRLRTGNTGYRLVLLLLCKPQDMI